MSMKWYAKKVGDAHYVLEKFGEMKCDVHAFLSDKLYESSEEGLWTQAVNSACYPGAIGMYLQPDCHLGYSIPVGGVLVTEDTIIQAGSGYDISCGCLMLKAPTLHASDVADFMKRRAWCDAVEARVATGYGDKSTLKGKKPSMSLVDEILRFGAKAIGVDADLCERQYIPIPDNVDLRSIQKAYDKTQKQLGSVGGGESDCHPSGVN